MPFQLKRAHAAAAVVVVAGCGALASWYVIRSRSLASPQALLACLPRTGAVTVYLDMAGLRRSGILDAIAGSKATEDLEYKKFVQATGFDYRNDLEAVAAAFSGKNSHMVLRWRFRLETAPGLRRRAGGQVQREFSLPGRFKRWPLRFFLPASVRSDGARGEHG